MDEIKVNESSSFNITDFQKVFSPSILDDKKHKKSSNTKNKASKNKGI